jgi:tRNA (cytidine/uridine-2'-O-)-methyltransferase
MNQRQNMNRNESERQTTGNEANSVSRPSGARNDTIQTADDRLPQSNQPAAHVVLYQPEIPQNTGNIGRTCVAVGAKLWIVRPAGFQIDDNRVRRAGLDYWKHLDLGDAASWDDLLEQLNPQRIFFLSKFAKRTIWDAEFQPGDTFVFGRETSGLPDSILDPHDPRSLRLPISDQVRSLNLATTVGIVLFEQQRQIAQRITHESSP